MLLYEYLLIYWHCSQRMGCWLWWDISSSCRWAGHVFFLNPSELQQAWERDGLLTSTHGFFNWNSQPFFFRLLDSFHIFQDFASFPSVFAGHQSYVMSLSGASVGRWCCRWWQPSNASSCWSLETMAPGMETRQCGDGAHRGQGSKHWNLVLDTYNINIT